MLKETITYTDFNGIERKEDFYFNLTRADLYEMEMTTEGGLSERLQRIVDAKDIPAMIRFYKELLLQSYGIKSDDGRRHIKSPEISAAFTQTEAYSIIFTRLIEDPNAGPAFVNAILPKQPNNSVAN